MTSLGRIYLLVDRHGPGVFADGRPSPSQREFFEYDRFAEELQQQTVARVEVMERWVKDAPRDGIVLIAYHIAMKESLLAMGVSLQPHEPRPLLLNMQYDDVSELAELVRPAGIVLGERLVRWRLGQEDAVRRQVYGLKSLTPSLAPMLTPNPLLETEHYCTYSSGEVVTLPLVLARYIDVYWQDCVADT